jgi:uncharacterized repeat protein (TIGR03803 family)
MLNASGQNYIYEQLYAFGDDTIGYARDTNGYAPEGALVQGADGNFYGTCADGGQPTTNNPAGGYGTMFRMTPDGALTTIAWFDGTSGVASSGFTNYGEYPFGSMIQATDGNLYGTSEDGGFRVTPSGVLTGGSAGGGDRGDPIQGTNGYVYGADAYYSIIFWDSLDGRSNGYVNASDRPSGGLIQASDGNFYGLTANGGTSGFGTAYKLTPDGVLTTLASFGGTYATRWPYGKLLQASDGNLYGVASSGEGVIFRLTLAGTITNLAAFGVDVDGQSPNGGLIEANDGNFYGTTAYGGISSEGVVDAGTVFKITPQGKITTLFAFSGQSGSCPGETPLAGLVQGSDGNLYGTCAYGGDYGGGNIFRIIMPGPQLSLTLLEDKALLSWRTNYAGYTLQISDGLTPSNWTDCTKLPAVSDQQYCVTNVVSPGSRFFRLRK